MAVLTFEEKSEHDADIAACETAADSGDLAGAIQHSNRALLRVTSAGVRDNIDEYEEAFRHVSRLADRLTHR